MPGLELPMYAKQKQSKEDQRPKHICEHNDPSPVKAIYQYPDERRERHPRKRGSNEHVCDGRWGASKHECQPTVCKQLHTVANRGNQVACKKQRILPVTKDQEKLVKMKHLKHFLTFLSETCKSRCPAIDVTRGI